MKRRTPSSSPNTQSGVSAKSKAVICVVLSTEPFSFYARVSYKIQAGAIENTHTDSPP